MLDLWAAFEVSFSLKKNNINVKCMSDKKKKKISSLYVLVHVLLRDKSHAHHKIIISIHTGLVVHTDTHPGIGSVLGIGPYPEPRYGNSYREGKKGIGASLV